MSMIGQGGVARQVDNKFLTFSLGEKEYGVDIIQVREIIGFTEVTPVPRAETFMRGVIDLRGKIVPIMDLRSILGMETVPPGPETCVVIVELHRGTEREMLVGFVVDAMQEVRQIDHGMVERAPDLGGAMEASLIRGFAKLPTGIVVLLEIDLILDGKQTSAMQAAMQSAVLSGGA